MSLPQRNNESLRIPHRRYLLQVLTSMMSNIVQQAVAGNEILDKAGWTGRRVMGFKLPSWQREEAWSLEQSQNFITSAYSGVHLGTYMVNNTMHNDACDMVLVDGQQRLRAIERYLADQLPVAGEDGQLYLWSQLSSEEQKHFWRIPFSWSESSFKDERALRDAYNRHNFGGTPHREDQKA